MKNNSLLPWKSWLRLPKGTVCWLCAAQVSSVFSWKDNRTVILTWQDFCPDCTTNGDLLFTFSSNILDFQGSFLSYLKFGSWHEDSSRFCCLQGGLTTQKSCSACFKNSFCNVKLCLICSDCSFKHLKDIDKNAISAW